MSYLTDQCKTHLEQVQLSPLQQIFYLDQILESTESLMRSERQWINWKLRQIKQQMNNPTPKQRILVDRKNATVQDQHYINLLECVEDAKSRLQESYVR